ncbi:sensor histidine kinase [Geomesophilobacter sediminis]|uniref:histidine kinase n=1 Tax=Geomesophilobacter sediminis TaxID=2798584 RepID=A0A8J7M279_9BACT|nr:sensor histidine kinase [Geomesophilobacter sediminis]MBJ6727370.1 sensor histidine kinase [Geomesophilobacter sediminis]
MFFSNGHPSIRSKLASLVLVCVVPFWFIAALISFNVYLYQVEQASREMLVAARQMSQTVDRELVSVISALSALGTSPSVARGDFEEVRHQALDLLRLYPDADIIVADASGQQLLNSFRPLGTPLPKRNNPEQVRQVFATAKPVVSNLFQGAVTKRLLISIDVPILRDGRVVYDLSMTFPAARLSALLARQKLPESWYASIIDRNQVVIARTIGADRFVGRRTSLRFTQTAFGASEGNVRMKNIEGIDSVSAFNRVAASDWLIAVGVPRATLMADIYRWVAWVALAAVLISLTAGALAWGIGRRIAQDLQSLVQPALAIGRGESLTLGSAGYLQETFEVAQALTQASELLQRREAERDRAETELSQALVNLQKETAERIRAIEDLREQEQVMIKQSRQAALGEMIGNIAHQWRQPLNSLGLIVQGLPLYHEAGLITRDLMDQCVHDAMAHINHMSQTIEDFRNFFKPEKDMVDFDVNQAIRQALSLVEGNFSSQAVEVSLDLTPGRTVRGYPNEFAQVLLILLLNARDEMIRRQVVPGRVTIRTFADGGHCGITVSDNAGGISGDIIDRIFEPYFSTKGVQGTGIGLYMAKNIIEKNMNGRLTVRNSGPGAEFTIEV